jgi:hypothetical protein
VQKVAATTPIVSYPSDQVASFLQNTYTTLAVSSPTDYPSTDTLGAIYGGLGYANRDELEELNNLWRQLAFNRVNAPATHAGPIPYANDWTGASIQTGLAALRFYHMAAQGPPATPGYTIDFHRALTFLNQHRALQRALGLVFDVTISVDSLLSLLSKPPSPLYVQASLIPNPTGVVDFGSPVVARTRCVATTSAFKAFESTPQIVDRQLTLGDSSSFAIYEIDVDGGGLHTAQFADNLKLAGDPQGTGASENGPAPDAPTSYAPPALRSAGLTVAAVNRGVEFQARLARNDTVVKGLPGTPPDFTAEDLVRGYVLDVSQDGTNWLSTGMRQATYTASGNGASATVPSPPPANDEAATDSPPRSQSDPTNSSQQQLNLPANIIRWNGWSNAAPRPGSPLADDGSSTVTSGTGETGTDPFSANLTITNAVAPGTLPRLRYGQTYALRARVMDIANNVIPLANGANAPDSRVSPMSVFGRHEPVGSPDLYEWTTPLPGESLKRLVIRDIDPSPTSLRGIAPNRIAESFAELHGAFDTLTGGKIDPGAYSVITENDAATFSKDREEARYPAGTAISFMTGVPYLPDPLARGGTVTVLDGAFSVRSRRAEFKPTGVDWPNYQPFGLALTPGLSQDFTFDPSSRTMKVRLTPGDTIPAQLSSHISSLTSAVKPLTVTDLTALGMYQWIGIHYGGILSIPGSLTDQVTGGLTWAITPWTLIEFVYAVRKPLLIPKFANVGALKQLSWTYAQISGDVTYSPKSTSHIDLLAAWGEPVDNGPGTGPPQGPGAPNSTLAPRTSTVLTIRSSQLQKDSEQDRFQGPHEFFDTKHRFVSYHGKATSRFTEHYQGSSTFAAPATGTPTALNLPGHTGLGLEPGSVSVTDAAGHEFTEGTGFTIDTTAGTITFLPAGPSPGDMVTVEFLPAVSVDSSPTVLNILSSARPLSADIEFVVPIFRWEKIRKHGKRTFSGRTSAGLRVFMSRPWWSSGIGELLGVTTYPLAEDFYSAAIPSPANLYVSDWGLDPVFRGPKIDTSRFVPPTYGKLPSPHPRLEAFVGRVHTGADLTIDEVSGVKVDVAGHEVHYDARRDLWYSDILIEIGQAYTPMIRLALARYQPDAVPGAELSRIALADVMSLDPFRLVSIVRGGPGVLKNVTLAGYSYSRAANQDVGVPGLATLVVERRVTGVHDEVIGWEPVSDKIEMRAITGREGITFWTAGNVKIPTSGKLRLFIAQYEVLPTDRRKFTVNITYLPSEGLRLLYQDLIPI